jgi:hypothetical protein
MWFFSNSQIRLVTVRLRHGPGVQLDLGECTILGHAVPVVDDRVVDVIPVRADPVLAVKAVRDHKALVVLEIPGKTFGQHIARKLIHTCSLQPKRL